MEIEFLWEAVNPRILSLAFAGPKHFTLLIVFPLKAQALHPLVSLLVKQGWIKLTPALY